MCFIISCICVYYYDYLYVCYMLDIGERAIELMFSVYCHTDENKDYLSTAAGHKVHSSVLFVCIIVCSYAYVAPCVWHTSLVIVYRDKSQSSQFSVICLHDKYAYVAPCVWHMSIDKT